MNTRQYLRTLKQLNLAPASKRTAQALGAPGVRSIQKWASGEVEIPGSVELLLAMYVRHGMPEQFSLEDFWNDRETVSFGMRK